ncbi:MULTISPECIES: bifunctional 2-polyprenyl-6-hydroxyphenol methylase/3-demethylubiquinol 3-O-methyltransferase UbiG [unclassified Duganella]|uniref:class I SAM-dependent methyltransferase n=1 Tax=unclassified Duganella TaxID=2636909 RepID=UPI0008812DD8|nr:MULTISPECIES: class I SAM-dependent methyltransferase [unclassified Duganella]SDG44012.1 Methyltransferase domain-containing protein [Duganella sp. OV458]SDJ59896.1 Methyltransferase domain-containing protein [Duganella sp. OV510]
MTPHDRSAKNKPEDPSGGWEAIAADFLAARSAIGSGVVKQWAKTLRPGGDIVDIGCGAGVPVSLALIEEGFAVSGVDASPTLLSAFQLRFPDGPTACEAAQDSAFFDRQFDGAIAVGLMFLLTEAHQQKLIERVGQALKPGGRFLFSAPRERCEWQDLQTGRRSVSLGEAAYQRLLAAAGMHLVGSYVDEGDNYYFNAASS